MQMKDLLAPMGIGIDNGTITGLMNSLEAGDMGSAFQEMAHLPAIGLGQGVQ